MKPGFDRRPATGGSPIPGDQSPLRGRRWEEEEEEEEERQMGRRREKADLEHGKRIGEEGGEREERVPPEIGHSRFAAIPSSVPKKPVYIIFLFRGKKRVGNIYVLGGAYIRMTLPFIHPFLTYSRVRYGSGRGRKKRRVAESRHCSV